MSHLNIPRLSKYRRPPVKYSLGSNRKCVGKMFPLSRKMKTRSKAWKEAEVWEFYGKFSKRWCNLHEALYRLTELSCCSLPFFDHSPNFRKIDEQRGRQMCHICCWKREEKEKREKSVQVHNMNFIFSNLDIEMHHSTLCVTLELFLTFHHLERWHRLQAIQTATQPCSDSGSGAANIRATLFEDQLLNGLCNEIAALVNLWFYSPYTAGFPLYILWTRVLFHRSYRSISSTNAHSWMLMRNNLNCPFASPNFLNKKRLRQRITFHSDQCYWTCRRIFLSVLNGSNRCTANYLLFFSRYSFSFFVVHQQKPRFHFAKWDEEKRTMFFPCVFCFYSIVEYHC